MDAFQHAREHISDLLDHHTQWVDIERAIAQTMLEPDAKDALWLIAWTRRTASQIKRLEVPRHAG